VIELKKIFFEHPYQWIGVILFIAGLIYAAIKIKNEPNDYLKKASYMSIGPFELLIPSWWTLINQESKLFLFKRVDTNYAWETTFSLKNVESNSSRQAILKDQIAKYQIEFDSDFKEDHYSYLNRKNQKVFISRHEGMATKEQYIRSYADFAIIEIPEVQKFLIGISISSVLNGCVEGPYFEEVINRVTVS